MIPFDPALQNSVAEAEIKGPASNPSASEPPQEQNTNIRAPAPAAVPPADIAATADGDDVASLWQLGPNEPPNVLFIHGPYAARFDVPPPENPDPEEPADEVGEQLTARQLAFCERYVEVPVATRAARQAGYAEKTAAQQASRLMKHPSIMRRILELRRKRRLEEAYRRETLMDKFEAVFAEAIDRHEFYAAIQALTMQARLAGIREAMPGFRFMRQLPTAGEQMVWDAVGKLEQKLCEITVGDFPGAASAVPVPPRPRDAAAPSPPPKRHRRR